MVFEGLKIRCILVRDKSSTDEEDESSGCHLIFSVHSSVNIGSMTMEDSSVNEP